MNIKLRRTLIVLVEIETTDDQLGMPLFCAALREYTDAIEAERYGRLDVERYVATTGIVKTVHGVDERLQAGESPAGAA